MRVILVGSAPRRQKLRGELPAGVDVIGEAPTLNAGRALGLNPDAFLLPDAPVAALLEALTPREVQVLELVADGLPNKAVAARLGLSDETVKFHLGSVFGKLGASNRTDAVRIALKRGMIAI
jgi:DNA-binding NarL/FixJ family response regulator